MTPHDVEWKIVGGHRPPLQKRLETDGGGRRSHRRSQRVCLVADPLDGGDHISGLCAVSLAKSCSPINIRTQALKQIGVGRYCFHAGVPVGVVTDRRKTAEFVTELMYP